MRDWGSVSVGTGGFWSGTHVWNFIVQEMVGGLGILMVIFPVQN